MEIKKKLLDIVRDKIRFKHYSISTEKTYIHWIKRYIFFHNKKHPFEMGKMEIEQFLTYLAVENKVSPTTQNQAFSAILFLYKEVLGVDLSNENINGIYNLTVSLMHGCELRMSEVLSLRIKETTMIYTHVVSEMNKGKIISPLDF